MKLEIYTADYIGGMNVLSDDKYVKVEDLREWLENRYKKEKKLMWSLTNGGRREVFEELLSELVTSLPSDGSEQAFPLREKGLKK